MPISEVIETMEVDTESLQTLKRTVKQGPTEVNLTFSKERVDGAIKAGG